MLSKAGCRKVSDLSELFVKLSITVAMWEAEHFGTQTFHLPQRLFIANSFISNSFPLFFVLRVMLR